MMTTPFLAEFHCLLPLNQSKHFATTIPMWCNFSLHGSTSCFTMLGSFSISLLGWCHYPTSNVPKLQCNQCFIYYTTTTSKSSKCLMDQQCCIDPNHLNSVITAISEISLMKPHSWQEVIGTLIQTSHLNAFILFSRLVSRDHIFCGSLLSLFLLCLETCKRNSCGLNQMKIT